MSGYCPSTTRRHASERLLLAAERGRLLGTLVRTGLAPGRAVDAMYALTVGSEVEQFAYPDTERPPSHLPPRRAR